VKITQSKFVTNEKVTEFLNYSDLDACEIENRNECEENSRNHSLGRERLLISSARNCSGTTAANRPKKENIRHLWIEV
jgi:hypothetical protein